MNKKMHINGLKSLLKIHIDPTYRAPDFVQTPFFALILWQNIIPAETSSAAKYYPETNVILEIHVIIYMFIRLLLLVILSCAACLPGRAQAGGSRVVLPSARDKVYSSFYYEVEPSGDTLIVYRLHPITVFPPLKFKNEKEEQFYWRTVRNVKLTLPYAKLIRETLVETYEYIETFETQKEREAYLKRMEKDLFNQYKPVLKKFSKSQANLLVKLIQRETDQSSYDIVKAFLGSFRAAFWQGFGRFFGVNLRGKFNPASNREDAIIDRVATLVEEGRL